MVKLRYIKHWTHTLIKNSGRKQNYTFLKSFQPDNVRFGGNEMSDDIGDIEISEDEIREHFKMLTLRPITQRTLSVAKCIAKVAQWHIIEVLKLGLMPVRVGNYYLIKADLLDKLFKELDRSSFESDNDKPEM